MSDSDTILFLSAGLLFLIGVILAPGLLAFSRGLKKDLHQDGHEAMEHTLAQLYERLDVVESMRQSDHEDLIRYSTELGRTGILLERWRSYARLLLSILEKYNEKPPPPPQEINGTPEYRYYLPVSESDPRRLKNRMIMAFSADEVNSLAFDLGLLDALSGDTLTERTERLIDVARRRGKIGQLLALCREQRPEGGF